MVEIPSDILGQILEDSLKGMDANDDQIAYPLVEVFTIDGETIQWHNLGFYINESEFDEFISIGSTLPIEVLGYYWNNMKVG